MDFGDLEEGETQFVDLIVRGNVDYTMFFESDNRGVLRHETDRKSAVPYLFSVGDTTVDLSGGRVEVPGNSGPTTVGGDSFPISVSIGSIALVTAGNYADHITITVRSR
jgi:hypothetical protein